MTGKVSEMLQNDCLRHKTTNSGNQVNLEMLSYSKTRLELAGYSCLEAACLSHIGCIVLYSAVC